MSKEGKREVSSSSVFSKKGPPRAQGRAGGEKRKGTGKKQRSGLSDKKKKRIRSLWLSCDAASRKKGGGKYEGEDLIRDIRNRARKGLELGHKHSGLHFAVVRGKGPRGATNKKERVREKDGDRTITSTKEGNPYEKSCK